MSYYTINTENLTENEKYLFKEFYETFKKRNLQESLIDNNNNWEKNNPILKKTIDEELINKNLEINKRKRIAKNIKIEQMKQELNLAIAENEIKLKDIKEKLLELETLYDIKNKELSNIYKTKSEELSIIKNEINEKSNIVKKFTNELVNKCPLLLTHYDIKTTFGICNLCGCCFFNHKLPQIEVNLEI